MNRFYELPMHFVRNFNAEDRVRTSQVLIVMNNSIARKSEWRGDERGRSMHDGSASSSRESHQNAAFDDFSSARRLAVHEDVWQDISLARFPTRSAAAAATEVEKVIFENGAARSAFVYFRAAASRHLREQF